MESKPAASVILGLVNHLYGEAVARGIGEGLIISWPPAPGTMPALVIAKR